MSEQSLTRLLDERIASCLPAGNHFERQGGKDYAWLTKDELQAIRDRAAALEAELALRDKLQDTTAQLRADCGKMAQARDAAVNLLVELGAELRDKAFDKRFLPSSTRDVIAQTIALLSGPGEDDESFPDVV